MARVLLIDDDEQVRSVLKYALEAAGQIVSEADSGLSAMKLLEKDIPDLVITDIFMPGKEGLETIIELKSKHPNLVIFAMSGGGSDGATDYLHMALKFGVEKVFQKPFNTDDLIDAVNVATASSSLK